MNNHDTLIDSLRNIGDVLTSHAADVITSLQSRVVELESRLEISPHHRIDGIMARDIEIDFLEKYIEELQSMVKELETRLNT